MKPAGVYFLLARWPEALTGRLFTALLAAIGGITFAVVENIIYLNVYFPEHSPDLLVYRYTVCLALHMVCSFIVGFGINQRLLDSVRGEIPFLAGHKKYFIIPMVIHSLYNGVSVFIEAGGLVE